MSSALVEFQKHSNSVLSAAAAAAEKMYKNTTETKTHECKRNTTTSDVVIFF